jgi:hypothetical protein
LRAGSRNGGKVEEEDSGLLSISHGEELVCCASDRKPTKVQSCALSPGLVGEVAYTN